MVSIELIEIATLNSTRKEKLSLFSERKFSAEKRLVGFSGTKEKFYFGNHHETQNVCRTRNGEMLDEGKFSYSERNKNYHEIVIHQ